MRKKMILADCVAHPSGYALTRALREGSTEGAVTAEAALLSQLLDTNRLLGSYGIFVSFDEIVDTQVVAISVVRYALAREIMAEIITVGANGLCQLL